ncbi:MAG: 50S ribosomal protein L13 [Methanosaeta sp. PtaB.Bin039]|nr:MAG: 50S ribosomal protein L13 [Methanosaeta sp. PtaB.Bin039]OPY45605.1 MAG: 50S ribosomal protein L13 [Methanosaeta sp. PtaU1.Bin028]HOT07254.1 50S ribosomal protein L13 [Methanotrichaceae archaeon]HQF17282.1 50S ribosomal protein L13 [Methanotrichaceae archaeon]HQI91855.1 50S ribosomal protein L13 [Methanotrichaceae archaeon]
MILDASGLVLGRLASVAATLLLKGEELNIVNVEKAVITGRRETVFREYNDIMQKGSREKGPHFPKRPDRIMKRTVRGMLPYKTKRGRDAMSRLRVYVGVPAEFSQESFEQPEGAKLREGNSSTYIELGELSKRLGSKF